MRSEVWPAIVTSFVRPRAAYRHSKGRGFVRKLILYVVLFRLAATKIQTEIGL
jgi:hypothetical protein